MVAIKLAEVVFLQDKVKKIIPTNYLLYNRNDKQAINPENDQDFEGDHIYYARWYYCGKRGSKCDGKHVHRFNYYKAKVFHLGGYNEFFNF